MKTNLHYRKLVAGVATAFLIIQGCKTNDLVEPNITSLKSTGQLKNLNTFASSQIKNDTETDGYIVILKTTTNTYKNNYKNIDKSYKGLLASMQDVSSKFLQGKNVKEEKIKRVFSSIPGFVASLTDAEADLLKNDADVEKIEVNHVFNAIQGTTVNSGLLFVSDSKYNQTFNMFSEAIPTGITRVRGGVNAPSGATAWVVDTGCDLTHSELNIDQTRAISFVSTESSSAQDLNGHGTHVAGTVGAKINNNGVVGVSPNTLIVPVKVADQYGNASDANIISGLDYVIAHATGTFNAVNVSLGSPVRNTSTILDDAVIRVANANISIVIAAGNQSDDTQYYPMARVVHSNVYVIAAIDATNDNFCTTFSNYGASVTSAEPGLNVTSTWLNNGYNTISGTSMAAPHFTGLLLMPNTDDARCRIAPFSTKTTNTSQASATGYCTLIYPESNAHNVPAGGSEIIREHQRMVYRSSN